MSHEIEPGKLGQSYDDYLEEQGTLDSATEQAIKRVIAHQLAVVMQTQQISKAELARRLETSRSQIDRLLDPANDGVTLGALSRAAQAVGRTLRLELS
ncbi:helix-turn-helix domain-containing protein [Hoeflea ulvae]|uniref:Helix-turn-helix domain-containing protein n=1 Tax=Hoeflea ulvae TaxID=2983764 RepID=A0ABT3YEL1_9HYPH|nr:helix-turn-helix transcriptional regulator [Hoeflea ulvae]MCY0094328.1 helix-turn-helix domain-containing protein [Hoeflea ulvae]